MRTELHACCAQLIGAVVNGAYQGILVWVLVALLLRCWGRANAATRHAVWFATLLLVAFLIPAHYWLDARTPEMPRPVQSALTPSFSSLAAEAPPMEAGEFGAYNFETPSLADPLGMDVEDRQWTDLLSPGSGSHEAPLVRASEVPVVASSIGNSATESARWQDSIRAWAARLLSPICWKPESAVGFGTVAAVSLFWFAVAAVRLVVLFCRLGQLERLVRRARPVDPEVCALFKHLLSQLRLGRAVNLRATSEQRSAVFVGLRRPTILLPEDSVTNLDEVGHVLRHELAHVQRYDDWTNLIQHVMRAVLFFHPAVLWISQRLALEREIACDDQVLQLSVSRRGYALTLANMAARIKKGTPLLAPGVSHSHSQLQQRISMILNTRRNSSPKLAKAGLASAVSIAAVAAALGVYFAPRLVLAAAPSATAPTLRSGSAILTAPGTPALAAAEPAEVASVGASITAEGEAPAAAGAGIEPGPKFKPDAPPTEPPEPSEAAPGQPPEPPSIDLAPRPPALPRVARAGKPGRTSRPEDSIDGADNGNTSIEERLRRLEKMVRSLMDQQNAKRAHATLSFKDGANENWNVDQEQVDKLKGLTERQSARALEQAQRAVEQANRAKKDLAARRDEQGQDKGELREALQRQLEALRQAREGLGREMERLDRQIQKLQQEQERGERDNGRRHGAVSSDKLHAQISADPSVAVNADTDVSVTREVTVNTEVNK